MMTFKEFYAANYYNAKRGHWAGGGEHGEQAYIVLQRLADAFAAYADYIIATVELSDREQGSKSETGNRRQENG